MKKSIAALSGLIVFTGLTTWAGGQTPPNLNPQGQNKVVPASASAPATPTMMPGTRVAVLNINSVLKNYSKAQYLNSSIKNEVAGYADRMNKIKEEIAKRQTEMGKPTTTTPQREAMDKEIVAMNRQLQDMDADARKTITAKQGSIAVQIFKEIETVVDAVAKTEQLRLGSLLSGFDKQGRSVHHGQCRPQAGLAGGDSALLQAAYRHHRRRHQDAERQLPRTRRDSGFAGPDAAARQIIAQRLGPARQAGPTCFSGSIDHLGSCTRDSRSLSHSTHVGSAGRSERPWISDRSTGARPLLAGAPGDGLRLRPHRLAAARACAGDGRDGDRDGSSDDAWPAPRPNHARRTLLGRARRAPHR